MRRPSVAALVPFAVVGAASLFVLSQLQPGLLLSSTTPSGGDMGAHVWGPAYLRDHLLPHGRLTGWTPDWSAGFPWLTFYFPLPSLLIVLADVVLPYGVAFKLVTVLGLVTLPVAAWAFGRLSGMAGPGPACLAVATVPFLFERSFIIYGGNIPSTLAGEFAFSISLSLALVFLGVVARGLETRRHQALAATLLALTGLCHVIPVFFALAGMAVLTVLGLDRRRLRYALEVGVVGGLVAAFWVVPFLARLAYTTDMGWEKLELYRQNLLPANLRWALAMAGTGAVVSVLLRRRTGSFLAVMALLAAAGFRFAPPGRLWNARVLPFWFLCVYLLAGVAVAEVGAAAVTVLSRDRARGRRAAAWLVPPCALAAALGFVATPLHLEAVPAWARVATEDRSFIPGWVKWNYSGYEGKASYPEYRNLVDTMAAVGRTEGCGRAMWEYDKPLLDRYGTPMALMLLPYWTHGCIGSMEGLFFESSATTPYHFLNQSELSKAPSGAHRNLPYRDLDVASGIAHLELFGVRYYMAVSPEAQAQARARADLRLVASSGPWKVPYPDGVKDRSWEIYQVAGSELVTPLADEPVVMTGVAKGVRAWLAAAVPWYQDPTRWDVPLAADGPPGWRRVRGSPPRPPRRPVPATAVSDIRHDDDRVSFDVDRPGSPVLVKVSYFPNWQARGAKGPWRVTPNLMVVVPTGRHVELHYGLTPVDALGWVLTALGLVGLVVLHRRPVRHPGRHRGEEPEGGPGGDEDDLERELAVVLAEAPAGPPAHDRDGQGGPGDAVAAPDDPR